MKKEEILLLERATLKHAAANCSVEGKESKIVVRAEREWKYTFRFLFTTRISLVEFTSWCNFFVSRG